MSNNTYTDLCTREQSIMLKKLGFDLPVHQCYGREYYENHPMPPRNINADGPAWISCPTLHQVQTWLWDRYGLWVEVKLYCSGDFWVAVYDCGPNSNEFQVYELDSIDSFDHPLPALSHGIDKALEYIINNQIEKK